MSLLNGLETLLGIHQQQAQPQNQGQPAHMAPMIASRLQPMQYKSPLAPPQGASPASQQQYQQALAHYQQLQAGQGHFTRPAVNSVGQANNVDRMQFPILNQGGQFDPGFTPLQNSGMARPGANPYATGLQPASGTVQAGPQNFNPQNGIQLY